MRRKFWELVHDKLEQAWHWVYYAKLAPPQAPKVGDYVYSVHFVNSKGETTNASI